MNEPNGANRIRQQLGRRWSRVRLNVKILGQVTRSRRLLRDVDVIGRWARVQGGAPVISNRGRIELGARVRLLCRHGSIELSVGPNATLSIGERSAINYGTDIHAASSISIGRRVSIGPRSIIADSDQLVLDDAAEDTRPIDEQPLDIVIEDDVWLASRVTVRPGARIGAGSVITAGSVVTGTIPPGVIAGGSPIRVLRPIDEATASDLLPTVTSVTDAAAGAATELPAHPAPDVQHDVVEIGGLLISDFTIDPLRNSFERLTGALRVSADVAPFGAVVPTLLDPQSERTDFAVVWTRPQAVLASVAQIFDEAMNVSVDDIIADVDGFAQLISSGLTAYGMVFVPTWTVEPWRRGRGLSDMRPGGIRWALTVANARLAEQLASSAHVVVVDTQQWLGPVGEHAFSDRLWYLGKIPYAEPVFDRAARQIRDGLLTARGQSRKLIVVDLDNTMWGGVVGDLGWQSIRLGGHDGVGEAFVDFQRALRRLKERGVALAIVSKNEESVAIEAIDRHEEMALRRDDFVGWRINWIDKAQNIADLVSELNLGLQSVVFIDDNPHERNRVREALPEVFVPEWPEDPAEYVRALSSMSCFDTTSTTAEDRDRTELYATENERQELRNSMGTVDDWIRQLKVVVSAERLNEGNVPRATQLLNKTNQMNVSTRRLSEREFLEWEARDGRQTWCITVSDRLGDAGLTGVVSIETNESIATVVDFVLSCRVMGRRVEESMVSVAARVAGAMGARMLTTTIVPTEKNMPCRRFFEGSIFESTSEQTYQLDVADGGPRPDDIEIIISGLEPSGG